FLYRREKSGPATISLFCIGHNCFKLLDSYSDYINLHFLHRPQHIFLKYRFRNELVGGRTKVQPVTIEKMANPLPTSGERSFGVRIL
uniref:Uncharacterized protein n=1 Tax=Cucumis melo TaxID=3656 RepID=A0A9I9E278_CUCME